MDEKGLAGPVLKEGDVLNGKYTVECLIGAGGFGRTYRMRDNLLNIPVAVKELTNAAQKDKNQFLEEARAMARFSQNQGIVDVRDFFEANGTAYLWMAWICANMWKRKGLFPWTRRWKCLAPLWRLWLPSIGKGISTGILARTISGPPMTAR